MMGSNTRLKRFVYIVCLQKGKELLRNSFFKHFWEEWEIRYRKIFFFFSQFYGSRGFIIATFSEFATHQVGREHFIMFNIGGPSTGNVSFSSLVGIGSSMQLDGLEAMIIFISVSRDIVLKHLSVSLDHRSWQCCADSGQLSFGEIRRFKEESIIFFLIIFSSKKFMNLSLLKWKPSSLGECCFLVSFATVSKIHFRLFNLAGK